MSNLAKVIKEEISRVARKEQKLESAVLKKASSAYRSDIAALKRRVASLEQLVKKLTKVSTRASAASAASGATGSNPAHAEDPLTGVKLRFSGGRLRAQRDRQALSAPAMAHLVGVSAQTIYNWESGHGRPNATQLATIASVRKMKKAELLAATKA